MESVSETFLLVTVLVLILVSAFFSSAETGIMALNRYRLRHKINNKDRRAEQIAQLLKQPDHLLSVILIGNTITNIAASSVATVLGFLLLGDMGIWLATIILTLTILIFGEITPKTLAALHPERVAFTEIYFLKIIVWVLYPAAWVLSWVSRGLLKLVGVNTADTKNEYLSSEEFRTLVHEAAPLLPESDKEMLIGLLDLRKMTVDDIMVQRADIIGIDLTQAWQDIVRALPHYQHTRLPLFESDINQVKGVIHVRSILQLMSRGELTKESLLEKADQVYFIPAGTSLTTQLINFQANKCRVGCVVDEYGEIQGLLTLEDILEEVVGEFTTDISQTHQEIHRDSSGGFIIDGGANIRELNKELNWSLPTEGPKTLSGLIIEYLEAIPERAVCLRIAGYPMEIVRIQDNTVKAVRVYPLLKV